MESDSVTLSRRTVEEIFKDFSARRSGIVRALTQDVDDFYMKCDPDKDNLCLYGLPNDSWEVNLPAEEVPPEIPEPALGINFARDGMNRRDWLSLIAVHSDSWLLSVAFYLGARLNRNDRKRLFSMINEVPTVYEVLSGKVQMKDRSGTDSASKSRNSVKRSSEPQPRNPAKNEAYDDEDEEEERETCGLCGGNYNANEFWIMCDACERWFHGKCVKITPAKADSIKHYKCPSCSSSKKGRT
ncbi:hypothetical protein LUZ63_007516 [Rhynchospora breviuscula]|uniref:PHD finger protein ALFIN-LIKE n=1 Tax=Rhynchospora breviuscula TaxID=2022672 RepID=A0A9Q0CT29_9POAL|nr:hypothetical protein LUZ63_007516 [Rhynchospora breviuscula]